MLRSGKQVWEASVKRQALTIRIRELNFHVERFSTFALQASFVAGFALEGLVHMKIPDASKDSTAEFVFWLSGSLSMLFALYVLIIGLVASIIGHQIALFGADGKSVEGAVFALRKRRWPVFGASALSLLALIVCGAAVAFMKFGIAGIPSAVCFFVFCFWIFTSVTTLFCNLGFRVLVDGGVRIFTARGEFDAASLQPGYHGHVSLQESVL